MKASELRLGNLVSNMNPRHNDRILTIQSIGDNHEVNVFYRKYLLSELEPIPLTEEWFLKFGLQKRHGSLLFGFTANGYTIEIDLNKKEVNFNFDEYTGFVVNIKYVHQLQNLYFALTGEELTLNQNL